MDFSILRSFRNVNERQQYHYRWKYVLSDIRITADLRHRLNTVARFLYGFIFISFTDTYIYIEFK